ncbi:GntR family transcriptional regulator [Vallitalea pronyensis]|uniref:GntR family transcriptional regulator n=1 Tax=Vallitalea pronyensis TaxID=1348613 RepID=A0A8J8SGY3_9FIRM|nr:GntR family transcriptional regulator [Vallitalea pronyensis]QUI22874.1 GntR family transcriptional regulator [Vallitalea pronyensis]
MNKAPLDKNSSVPLYRQLIETIKEDITANVLKPGDQILTEIELSDKYEVSRITVRKAISELVEEGYLVKQQGVGTFVAEVKLVRNMNKFMGFSMSCEILGKKPSATLLFAGLVDATDRDRRELRLDNSVTKVLSIKRIRYCDGEAVMVEDSHFTTDYSFLLTNNLEGSLYKLLNEHHIVPSESCTELDVCFATDEEAELLHIEGATPLLLTRSVCYDKTGNIIHNTRQVVNPKKFKMIIYK